MKKSGYLNIVVEITLIMITVTSCNWSLNDRSVTPTNSVSSATFVNTQSTNNFENIHLTRRCVETALTMDYLDDGTIVYYIEHEQAALLNLASGQDIHLGETFPIMAVSPDFSTLAYTTDNPSELHLVNTEGVQLKVEPIPEDWQGVIQWIDEDNILIERFIYAPFREASTILYNLKTGNHKEFLPTYLSFGAFMVSPLWGNYSYSRMIFDRKFSRVIYPKLDNESYKNFTMIDVANQTSILQVRGFPDSSAPQWTKDGSFVIASLYPDSVHQIQATQEPDNSLEEFTYAGGFDLFRVDRNGGVRRLTYFTTQYHAAEEMISLSPNERYVAFWLNLDYQMRNSGSRRELAILDIDTGEVTNLCVSDTGTPFQPIWSSDGKKLIVNLDGKINFKTNIVLIDLEQNISYSVLWGGKIAKGWLSSSNP